MNTKKILHLLPTQKFFSLKFPMKNSLSKAILYLIPCVVLSCKDVEVKYEMKKTYALNLLEEKTTTVSRTSTRKSIQLDNVINGSELNKSTSSPGNKYYNAFLDIKSYLHSVESELQQICSIQEYVLGFFLTGLTSTLSEVIMNCKNQLMTKVYTLRCPICDCLISYGEHTYIYGSNIEKSYKAICNKCGLKDNRDSINNIGIGREFVAVPMALLIDFQGLSTSVFCQKPKIDNIRLFNFHMNNLCKCYNELLAKANLKNEQIKNNYNAQVNASNEEKKKIPFFGFLVSVLSGKEANLDDLEKEKKYFKERLDKHTENLNTLVSLVKMLFIYAIYKNCSGESDSYLFSTQTQNNLHSLNLDALYRLTDLHSEKTRTIIVIFSLLECTIPKTIIPNIVDQIHKSGDDWVNKITTSIKLSNYQPDLEVTNQKLDNILSLVERICNNDYDDMKLLNRYDPIKIQMVYKGFSYNPEPTIKFITDFAYAINSETHPSYFDNLINNYIHCKYDEIKSLVIESQKNWVASVQTLSIMLKCRSAELLACLLNHNLFNTLKVDQLSILYELSGKQAIEILKTQKIIDQEYLEAERSEKKPINKEESFISGISEKKEYPNIIRVLNNEQEVDYCIEDMVDRGRHYSFNGNNISKISSNLKESSTKKKPTSTNQFSTSNEQEQERLSQHTD